jgi:hypothetical protein
MHLRLRSEPTESLKSAACAANHACVYIISVQAFINTAREIYKKIQDGVFDVSNEVSRQALLQQAWPGRLQLLLPAPAC